jgi:hypothetical protein
MPLLFKDDELSHGYVGAILESVIAPAVHDILL